MNTSYDTKIQVSIPEKGAVGHKRKMVKPAFEIILIEDIDIATASMPEDEYELIDAPIEEEPQP